MIFDNFSMKINDCRRGEDPDGGLAVRDLLGQRRHRRVLDAAQRHERRAEAEQGGEPAEDRGVRDCSHISSKSHQKSLIFIEKS